MKKENDEDDLIARKLSGDLTEDELKFFDQKMASDREFKEKWDLYQEIWKSSSGLKVPSAISGNERWNKLDSKLSPKPGSIIPYLKYAAVIALLIVAVSAFFMLELGKERKSITAAKGEMRKVELPDHSVITLNSNSTISYVASDFSETRIVELVGEAFFEIQKSSIPFIVETDEAKVEVLGTTFNVRTFDQKLNVVCSTGKVRVSVDDEQSILTRGKGVQVDNHQLGEVYEINADNIALWREGKLYFRETPMKEVLTELERYFDVEILMDQGVRKLTFTGKFDHPQLEETLQTICLSAGLDYEMLEGNKIKIK